MSCGMISSSVIYRFLKPLNVRGREEKIFEETIYLFIFFNKEKIFEERFPPKFDESYKTLRYKELNDSWVQELVKNHTKAHHNQIARNQ